MDHKVFQNFMLKADASAGIVEAIVAVMGNDDLGSDVIWPGAFTKTITERLGKIRVLDQHRTDSVTCAVGRPLAMKELSRAELPTELLDRYPNATGGLYTKTQYLIDTPEGKGVFDRIAAGVIDEYSIGYDPLDVNYSTLKDASGKKVTVRNIHTVKLYEYSPVLWGMNPATQTLAVKGASGAAGLPLADRSRPWDAGAAEARVRSWADAADAPNAKYRQAFFWYDSDAPDNFTSYKLQFADIIDGRLTAVPRAIFAVAAALQGSRGGVDIPAGDKSAIQGKVASYYSRMRSEFDDGSIVPPWDKADGGQLLYKSAKPWDVFHEGDQWVVRKVDPDGKPIGPALGHHATEAEARAQVRALYANEGKSINLTQVVRDITEDFMEQFGMMGCAVTEVYDDHIIVCEMDGMAPEYYSVPYTVTDAGTVFAPKGQWIEGSLVFTPSDQGGNTGTTDSMTTMAEEPEEPEGNKAGRIFASRNEARLRQIAKIVAEALAELDKADESGAPDKGDNNDGNKGDKTQQARPLPEWATPTMRSNALRVIDLEIEQINLHQA